MENFTDDEVACLKKMVYKFRQDEILELYNRRKMDYAINKTTASGSMLPPKRIIKEDVQFKSFLVKVKNFFKGW